jgi:hypothetical protein
MRIDRSRKSVNEKQGSFVFLGREDREESHASMHLIEVNKRENTDFR